MINILNIIGILFIIMGLYNLYKMRFSFLYIKRKYEEIESKDFDEVNAPQLILLIPLLRESFIVPQMMQRLSSLLYPKDKIKIVLITTEREYEHSTEKQVRNTIEVVREELTSPERQERFLHIHYPHTKGIKSDQLNYALTILEKNFASILKHNTYIGVYDADSFTRPETLRVLAKEIHDDPSIDLFQQPTLYLKNRKSFEHNYLAKAFGFLQTAYAFYIEDYNILTHKQGRSFELLYAVGHGFFVKWSSLKSINLFPTPIEDTRLGHIFCFLDYKFKLLPIFDITETVPSALLRIKQSSVWFLGVSYFLRDLHIARSVGAKESLRMTLMACYRFYRNLVWSVRAFLLFAVCVALGHHYPLISFFAILIYLYAPVFYLLYEMTNSSGFFDKEINQIELSDITSLILLPFEYLNMSLGPIVGFTKRFLLSIVDEKRLYPKTERL